MNLSSRISELGKGKKIWIGTDVIQTWNIRRVDETLSPITMYKALEMDTQYNNR